VEENILMINEIWGIIPSQDMIYELESQLTQVRIENWLHQDLFSYQWWLLMAALFIPWLLWGKFVDKKRLIEITLFGAIVVIVTSFLDATLSDLRLWEYNYYIIPLWPRLISADFAIVPITYMFIYQYFQSQKSFLLAMLVVSIFFAFVGEPLLVWLDIYTLHKWEHVYSLPIYIALGALVKFLTQKILAHNE
jgi:hypothetical protein